ncbi:AAA family ATPase [Arthrobacter cryoconiti]|uniref:AAA family ATPase n=1 Tax=Arthrobacter cryoconiti TaxID=748907 RepID=A0ABV8QZT8_9MICC|nr:AAA family ATPase [Arthrobacter cryoconiti]MCC9068842.1 AAA family ATPase [Arthrobacter cryoconiti]
MSIQISSLDISNFQRLSAAKIEPTGSLIVLAGQNANGKTSVLDAIETTLCGFNARNTKRPIKDGHGKASIDIVLTDGTVVRRTFTPSGSTLSGTRPDGAKLKQADLNAIISQLGVDASTFATSGEKEQLKTLLSVVELPFVPAELDAQKKALEADRLFVGQQGKTIGDVEVNENLPTEETSASEIIAQIREAETANREVATAEQEIANAKAMVAQSRQELELAQDKLTNWQRTLESRAAAFDALPKPADTTALEAQLAEADDANAAIRTNNTARAQTENRKQLRAKWDELTDQIKAIDQTKKDGLAAVEMPIEGLGFDEEGVLYQGIPFSRASGAEQIIVSAAMIIATDPELRTMVIRNGNVLDKGSLRQLEEMLEDNNFLAFIEYVSDGEDHEFRLVNGELAA